MAVLDFPDTSDSPWYNPDTGITYVWRNGAWHIASGTDTDIFVSKTGDNMTGPLTLGTDKITLDATDGTAEFTGNVNIGDTSQATGGIQASAAGYLALRSYSFTEDVPVIDVYDSNNDPKAQIFANGNATFSGSVTAGGGSFLYGTVGINGGGDASDYAAVLGACLDPVGRVFAGADVSNGGNNITSKIYANGAATFAKEIVAGVRDVDGVLMSSNGTIQCVVGGVSQYTLVGGDGGRATFAGSKIAFGDDGSATFAQKNDNAKVYLSNVGAPGNQRGYLALYGEAVGSGITFYVNGVQSGTINYNGSTVFNLEYDNDAYYTTTTDSEGNETRVYNGPTLDVKDRLQNLIARLDALEADELAEDATSTLLLTTVNNLNADMAKTKAALTAIRTAANVAGTLEELKADIVTATADI